MSARYFDHFSRYLMLSLGAHSLLTLGMLQFMSTSTPDLHSPTPVSVTLSAPTLTPLTPHLNQKPPLRQPTHVLAGARTTPQPVTPAPATVLSTIANTARPALEHVNPPLPHHAPADRRVPVKRLSAPAARTPAAVPQAFISTPTPGRQPSAAKSVRALASLSARPEQTAHPADQAAAPALQAAPTSSTTASASALDTNRLRQLARRQTTGTPSPQFIYQPKPHYPIVARRRGWQGTVLLTIEMLADGTVEIIKVATSSGYPPLDTAAQKAVRKWRHRPLQHNGSPITRQANLPIHFRLD